MPGDGSLQSVTSEPRTRVFCFTTTSPGISCRDGTCRYLHNVSGLVSIGWRYHWLIYSMLLWFWDDYHSLLPPSHGECRRGPAVSSSRLVVFIGFILSYTELYRGLNGRAILLPQLEHHQFLFFIGASDSVIRQPFSFQNCKKSIKYLPWDNVLLLFFAQILSHGGSWWNIHWNIFE